MISNQEYSINDGNFASYGFEGSLSVCANGSEKFLIVV